MIVTVWTVARSHISGHVWSACAAAVCRIQSHLVAVLLEQFFGGFGRREGGLVRKRELQEEKTQTNDC